MNSEVPYQALWKLIVAKKVSPENAVKILKTSKQATISEIARKANLKPATLMRRLRVGVPMDLAISAPLKAGVKTLRANNGC
jgi:DNA-binding transcriptional ArsR family regulator